ncbi:MAG: N-acetylmuramic acid 6-phosphate etherase [Candidatus Riflebacteria bacterium]|nr:N-acetylmuramic acid 6-phosphate etherase [Candidatus Riflebacteria bacterium]
MTDDLRVTERPNEATVDVDLLSPLEVVRLINSEDRKVAEAVGRSDEAIARAVTGIMGSFGRGGRLIYVGAGTSGRLGVLDASECPPTFSTPESQVLGIIAGGDHALRHASEGAEDDAGSGSTALDAVAILPEDTVCGVTASGRTPYVQGALRHARDLGCFTILVTCNPGAELLGDADCVIAPVVGPEVIAGSTRLKAGTATKLVLNALTTASLTLSGKVYSNLMVDLRPGSYKLVERARWILTYLLGVSRERAGELFEASGRNVKVALVMGKRCLDRGTAERLLARCGGFLRKALSEPGA